MKKRHIKHSGKSLDRKAGQEDCATFMMTCIDTAIDVFGVEEFPYITIEILKSAVINIIKTDKRYVKTLRRRYGDVDEILEEISSKIEFLKDEEHFRAFLFMLMKEHNGFYMYKRDFTHFLVHENLLF